ncbi:MAG TPA: hypothetical protein DCY94_03615, partial [Firmicutes bacterium]|nr:hypothetical protein [Bacillota bacterium]
SYIMEKIFKVRYWDYSRQKLNLNGRICAEAIVLFGILGLFGIEVAFPLLFDILGCINETLLVSVAGALITLFLADLIVSTVIVIRHKSNNKSSSKDSTEEMSLYVKRTIMNWLVVDGITWNLPKLKVDFKKILEKIR